MARVCKSSMSTGQEVRPVLVMVVCEIWALRSTLKFAGMGSAVPSSELDGKVQALCFPAVWKHRAEKKDFVTAMSCVSFMTEISCAS